MARSTLIYDGYGAVGIPPLLTIQLEELAGKDPAELGRVLTKVFADLFTVIQDLVDKVNFGLSFGLWIEDHACGNFSAQAKHVIFKTAATPVLIPHGLGRVPLIYPVVRRNKPGDIYDAKGAEWTTERVYLQSEVNDLDVWVMLA